MTKEEKIKGLYSLKKYLVENPIDLEGHKSLPITLIDYSIEALEQEPILEKDGKLIVTTEHCGNVGRVLVQYGTNGTLFYQDQEPRKGHWVTKPHVFGVAYCSECDLILCSKCAKKMEDHEHELLKVETNDEYNEAVGESFEPIYKEKSYNIVINNELKTN